MTAWDDIRFEWTRGTFRLSTEDSITVMGRVAELEQLVAEVAALNPQCGSSCMWCRTWMSPASLNPADSYSHEPSCTWLRAVSATSTPGDGLEGHTAPTVTATSQETP